MHAYLYGSYNFNKCPTTTPGTRVKVHLKTWKSNVMGLSWHTRLVYWSINWPLQMHSVLHSHNYHCTYHWYTAIHPKGISFPKYNNWRLFPTSNWIHSINNPRPSEYTSFLIIRICKKKINHIVHILQRSTAHPHLKMLPLPPMLLQSHTQDISPDIITHPDAPYMRVEQVVQPPRVNTTRTSPTSPPRVQHTPSPRPDPFTNPWIKTFIRKKIYPRLSQLHKIKLHHIKFNITYVSPHAMVVPIYALNQHITL